MPWQPDAKHRHMQTSRNLHIQNGKRNWNSGASLQHLIQTTIQRIEKISLVAVESQLTEQITTGFFHKIASVVEVAETVAQRGREFIQLVEKRLRLKVGKVDTGQIQRCAVQTNAGAFSCQDLLQMIHLPLLYYPAVESTSKGHITETSPCDACAIEYVPRIQQDGCSHDRSQRFPVQLKILRPLGDQNQRIRLSSDFAGIRYQR